MGGLHDKSIKYIFLYNNYGNKYACNQGKNKKN